VALFPAVYRGQAIAVNGSTIKAYVPQVFGDTPITVRAFLGAMPTTRTDGWIFFQGGNPSYPVWAGGDSAGGGGEQGPPGPPGPPGAAVAQRPFVYDNRITAVDPGNGKLRTNSNDESLVTQIYVSLYDANGVVVPGVDNLVVNDQFYLYEANNYGMVSLYLVTDTPVVTANSWVTVPVTVDVYGGFSPSNNQAIVAYYTAPNQGGGGTGTDEVWIGTDDPIASHPTIELWFDTDAIPATPAVGNVAYRYVQGSPSATWVIVHNLGWYPNIVVEDSGGSTCEGETTWDNANQVTLTFSAAFAGIAYLS
jgi:hypothetical protein